MLAASMLAGPPVLSGRCLELQRETFVVSAEACSFFKDLKVIFSRKTCQGFYA